MAVYTMAKGSGNNEKCANKGTTRGLTCSTVLLLKNDPPEVVELQSSDDDEVVEIALPPRQSITIDISDEEIPAAPSPPPPPPPAPALRALSPNPSVVSSVSDDFIRGDCVAFNITRKPRHEMFDLSLHGTDLVEQPTVLRSTIIQEVQQSVKPLPLPVADETVLANVTCDADMTPSDPVTPLSPVPAAPSPRVTPNVSRTGPVGPQTSPRIGPSGPQTGPRIGPSGPQTGPRIGPPGPTTGPNGPPPVVLASSSHRSKKECRDEMERLYRESWGGESFDHNKLRAQMPRDKRLWRIDQRDRALNSNNKPRCSLCGGLGHQAERCARRQRSCHMCGARAHQQQRCPRACCLRCGAEGAGYSAGCDRCAFWPRLKCHECGQHGHPATHCPDLWRRYHSTIENEEVLGKQNTHRKKEELYCSSCARRGHLAHTCRLAPPALPPALSPYVFRYTPVLLPTPAPPKPRRPSPAAPEPAPTPAPAPATPARAVEAEEACVVSSTTSLPPEGARVATDLPSDAPAPAPAPRRESVATSTDDDVDESLDIPKKKKKVLKLIADSFARLKTDLGDPRAALRELSYLESNHGMLLRQKIVSAKKLKNNRNKMHSVIKTLNMILLGQAGLADGARLVAELRDMHARLEARRDWFLSQELRASVGRTYRQVFGPVARQDYADLVRRYCDGQRAARGARRGGRGGVAARGARGGVAVRGAVRGGVAVRGAVRGGIIARGSRGGISRGAPGGIPRGASRGVRRGHPGGAARGTSGGITRGGPRDGREGKGDEVSLGAGGGRGRAKRRGMMHRLGRLQQHATRTAPQLRALLASVDHFLAVS